MNVYVDTSGRGPHLALLHGWGLNGAVWDSVRAPLAENFTLHLVDLPGHGYSSATPFTNLAFAADAVAGVLPARCHVLGWSLGGQVALSIAQRHPASVNKLVLLATTPRFVEAADWPFGKKVRVLDDFAARLANNYAATIRGFLALQTLNQPDARKTIAAMQVAMSARGEPSAAALQAGLEVLRVSDLRSQLADIQHPALVMQGDHDALTAADAAHWLAEHLPNAAYALIEHAAHAPFLSHADIFLHRVRQFLAP